jgi:hypothetical protein
MASNVEPLVATPHLNTEHAGRAAYLIGRQTSIKCEVIGHYLDGRYVRVRLLERDCCHPAGDVVDYGAEWVRL